MKKANPKVIGAFVVGAVVILVIGLIAFGSGKAFEKRTPVVMLFNESLTGLNVGSPITFNGVTIGEVTEIRVEYNIETLETRTPVFGEIVPDRVVTIGEREETDESSLDALIAKGFRAQLKPLSLVTGQLAVEFAIQPDSKATMSGLDLGVTEIPTIESGLEALKSSLANLNLDELVNSGIKLINNVNTIVEAPEMKQTLDNLSQGIGDFAQTMHRVNEGSGPVVADIQNAASSAQEAFAAARGLINDLRTDADGLDAQAKATLTKIIEVLDKLEQQILPISTSLQATSGSVKTTFDNVNSMVERTSATRQDIDKMLRNLAAAADAIKNFAEELERNPEAIIRGRR